MNSLRKLIASILVTFSLVACSPSDPVLHDDQGHVVQLSALKGQWVVINIWASWCESCAKEVAEFNRFQRLIQGKDIVLYGLNFDQLSGSDLSQSISKMHIAYPVIVEDANLYWRMGKVDVLPTTFILNPKGKVVKMIVGATTAIKLMDLIVDLKRERRA